MKITILISFIDDDDDDDDGDDGDDDDDDDDDVKYIQNQVIVGFLFLIISGMNINDPKTKTTADILNNVILFIVFVITLVNAVISGFGIKHTDTSVLEALDR